MRVKTLLDVPGDMVQRAIIFASPTGNRPAEDEGTFVPFCLELVEDSSNSEPPTPGDWLSHFTLVVPSTAECLKGLRDAGHRNLIDDPLAAVIPIRSSSSHGGQSTQDIVAVVRDLDNYRWRIMEMQRAPPGAERLCTVALRVTSMERSLAWYSSVLGTRQQGEYVAPRPPEYRTALVGFGPELLVPQIELRQIDPPPQKRGTGFLRLVVSSSALDETKKALEEVEQEYELVELGSVWSAVGPPDAGLRLWDPDGWEIVLVEGRI